MWSLEPGWDYLNHGSYGACPRAVLDAQRDWRARIEASPVGFFSEALEPALDLVRARLGSLLGADPDDLALVPNATTGVNTVVQRWPLAKGDAVLVTDHGYQACTNAVRFSAERAGAEVVVAKVPFPLASPDEVVASVLAAVTPRTRFAVVDHVTSPTGLVLPIEPLVRGLQARGVQVLVDGAHAPGMVPLQLEALGADWYTGNLHKWVCTPKGSAFLWVRKDRQATTPPLVVSHGHSSPRRDRSRFQLEHALTATQDPTPWLCVGPALDVLETLEPGGLEGLMRHNHALALEAQGLLADALQVPRPAPASMIGALATLPLPAGVDAQALHRRLRAEHHIEVPVFSRPVPPTRAIRVSAQHYNRRAQYERLAALLPSLLA